MKSPGFVLFFSIALSVYALMNAYVFIRGLSALNSPAARAVYAVVFWAFALSFIAGRSLERTGSGAVVQSLIWIGSFWFAVMAYGFLIALLTDLSRLVNHFGHFLPAATDALRLRLFLISLAAILLLLSCGYVSACRIRIRSLDITLPAGQSALKALTVAAASDIHLGTIVGKRRLSRIVDSIQSLKPDLILFPGDIIDEDPQPAIRKNLGKVLMGLSAPLGVFACTGNHEYIGGIEATSRYLDGHGITLLRDTAVLLNGGLAVAGREDAMKERFTGEKRKPLKGILSALEPGCPVIVMDHEPSALSEAAESNADVLLCGHTHAGQFWPVNHIVNAIFELAYGYKVKGRTHVIVSSGAGTWGPPIRICAPPEIVCLRIRFE